MNLTIREGADGKFWALLPTFDGFQVFEGGRWTALPLPAARPWATASERGDFVPWAPGRLLYLSASGLFEFDRSAATARPVRPPVDLGPWSTLVPSNAGGALACGARGVASVTWNADGPPTWKALPFPQPQGRCRFLLEDEHGELFASAGSRLLRYDGSTWHTVASARPGEELRGWPDLDGGQWVSVSGDGVFRLTSGSGEQVDPRRGLSGRLLSVLYDGRGRFWLATSLGLAHYAPAVWRTPPDLRSLRGGATAILGGPGGDLYVMHGRELLHRTGGRWKVYPSPPGYNREEEPVGNLARLADGRVVLGTGPALLVFDPRHPGLQTIRHPDGLNVSVLGPGRNNSVWLLTSPDFRRFRIERFDGRGFTEVFDAGTRWGETFPRAVCEASDGSTYLVPVPQGIGVIQGGHYSTLGDKQGYTGAIPVSVAEVSPGRMWFGDRNQVVELDGTRWSTVRADLQTVRSILPGKDGAIWLGTGRGVSRFRRGDWIQIGSPEGLPDGAVYGLWETTDGTIWAATSAGVGRRDAAADTDPPLTTLPPQDNPARVPPGGEARFVFSGIDRWKATPTDRLLYSWRVDGGPWSELTADPAADLRGLRHGRAHQLQVRAVDRNGNFDATPAAHSFEVLLPWYQEPGFLAACFLCVAALAALVVLTFVRQRQLARLVERRTAALAARNSQFQQIATAVPGVLYSFRMSPEGAFSVPYVNPRFHELTGVPPELLVKDATLLFDLIHPDDLPGVKASIAESAASMTLWCGEFRVCQEGRPEIWLEGRSVPSREKGGSILWHGFMADITEKKRWEETVRRETQREMVLLQTLVARAPYGVAMLDRQLRHIQGSDKWLQDLGMTADQALGQPFFEMYPEMRARWQAVCERVLAGEVVTGADDRIVRRDGEVRWFNWTMCPWGDAGDASGGIIVYTEDTTERKRAEEAARLTEVRYTELFQHMSESLIYCRMIYEDGRPVDFEYLAVNESYRRMPRRHGGVGQRVSDVFPGIRDLDPGLFEFYGRVAGTGVPAQTEMYVQAAGEWYSMSAYCPQPGHFVGIFQVITPRKRAEQDLRRSQAMLHSVVNSALDGVIAIDSQERIVLWNPAAERIFGYSAEEAMNQRLHRVIASADRQQDFQRGFSQMLSTGDGALLGRTVELIALRKDGSEFPVELSVAPVHTSDSFHAVGVVRDITARRTAQLERDRLQSQFLQAQKMETVGRLAGGIAHDFNNLLTVINGYAQLAADQMPVTEPARATIAEIARAGQRATALVRQLLVFSRKEVARLEVIDLNAVISEMNKSILYLVGEDLTIVTRLAGQVLPVRADRNQLGQVLMNLIVNARDAMPGSGTITVSTRSLSADSAEVVGAGLQGTGPWVCLTVRDTGSGIDESARQHLFEPFFTTKPAGKGTGLGLSVVHGIVSACGGGIHVESAPGEGAAFHICLPQTAPAAPEPEPEPEKETDGVETVLLAEDEPEVRHYVAAVLGHFKYRVLECSDADEAIEVLKRERVDLLLTDVVMPKMSGRDLVLRAKSLNPGLRVLFMSGYPGDALDGLGELIGTHAFIQKPFTPKDLAARVRQLLAQPRPPARVLVADDEPAIRQLLRLILESEGYVVFEAASLEQACDVLHANLPDLVVTDLNMPGVEGTQAVDRIRSEFPDLRLIAMSGGTALSRAVGLGAAGPQGVVEKPIQAAALLHEVRRVLGLVGGAVDR